MIAIKTELWSLWAVYWTGRQNCYYVPNCRMVFIKASICLMTVLSITQLFCVCVVRGVCRNSALCLYI